MTYIYIIGPVEGYPVKIGIAKNVGQRLKTFQTANWVKLKVHYKVRAKSRADAFILETKAHRALKRKKIREGGDEWFAVNADTGKRLILRIAGVQKPHWFSRMLRWLFGTRWNRT